MYYKYEGVNYNLNKVIAIQDVSGQTRPGYYLCKKTNVPTWWEKHIFGRYTRIAGKYYAQMTESEQPIERATYRGHVVRIYFPQDSLDWYGREWTFETKDSMLSLIEMVQFSTECKIK